MCNLQLTKCCTLSSKHSWIPQSSHTKNKSRIILSCLILLRPNSNSSYQMKIDICFSVCRGLNPRILRKIASSALKMELWRFRRFISAWNGTFRGTRSLPEPEMKIALIIHSSSKSLQVNLCWGGWLVCFPDRSPIPIRTHPHGCSAEQTRPTPRIQAPSIDIIIYL